MTSTVKNIKVGNTSYPVQDAKATPFLSSADEATLLSNGTYRGETVANNTIFTSSDGVLKNFTKTVVGKAWQTGTAQTRLGNTGLSIFDQVSAQNADYVVTSFIWGGAKRSVDRGSTWVSAGNSSYNASSSSCTVYVQKTGKFYCGTSLGLLATDGTTSFSRVGSSTSSVATYATDGNTLCCFGGCYTFDNEGNPTWTAANYNVVAVRYDSVSGVFYGQRQITNGYYESTDGYTWTLKGSPGQYFNWVAKHGNIVVGFRRNGSSNTKRYVSTDGGVNWSSEAFADQEWFGGVYQGLFYMGRTGAVADFMISTDGVSWTHMYRPDTASAQALVMVDNKVYMGNYAYYFTTGIDYSYALTPVSYTASEVDIALGEKQDTLTAGTGITIEGTAALSSTVTIVGSPTMTSTGIASGFSDSNYYYIPNLIKNATRSFEIVTAVNMTTAADNNLGIIDSTQTNSTKVGLRLTASTTNTVRLRVSTEGGSTYPIDITGTTPLTVGTKIWIKVTYNSSSGYVLYTSTDGSTWTTEGTSLTTTAPYANDGFYVGDNSATGLSLTGSIYMLDMYIKVDDVVVFRAANVVNPVISSTGGGSSYTAGDGISISNSVISLTTPYEVVQTLPGSPTAGTVYFVTGS